VLHETQRSGHSGRSLEIRRLTNYQGRV
jgi:hypothetical protein